MRLGILVSGRGSNLEAVLSAIAEGRLHGVVPVVVISNRPNVRAVAVAKRHGVPVRVLRRADHPDAESRDAAIGRTLAGAGADLALLAGYDQLLLPAYFRAFAGRTINIHPSLLPRHGGRGMIGLAVHAAVLAAGDRQTGVTVHEVTAELDGGPVIGQVPVEVRDDDTVDELAARVLRAEHRFIVRVLERLAAETGPVGASASMTAAPGRTAQPGATEQRSPFDA